MAYKSKGTVRLASIRSRKLIFVPDNDHSVKNGDDKRAVFFDSTDGRRLDRGKIVDQDASGGGVSVTLKSSFLKNPLASSLLVSAAVAQIKVEIKVKISSDVKLINIGLPAK